MECSKAREALSAVLDGGADGHAERGADRPPANVHGVPAVPRPAPGRSTLLTYAAQTDAPDLSAEVLEAARAQRHRPDPWMSTLRLGLVAVAIAQLALAVPGLVYGSDEGAPIHIAHEVGSWDLALAVGVRVRGLASVAGRRSAAVRGGAVGRARS